MIVVRQGVVYENGNYRQTLECQKVSQEGQNLWGNGVIIDSILASYSSSQGSISGMISDGTGGAIISFAGKVYRVDSNGAKLWGPVQFSNYHYQWRITPYSHVPDGSGGVYISWIEFDYDTNVIHIDGNGRILWKKIILSRNWYTGYMTQYGPVSCSDGQGGVIVAWLDYRFPPFALRAQRLNFNGDSVWNPDGIILSNQMLISEAAQVGIMADLKGGAFISWSNYGNSLSVQHLDNNGEFLLESNGRIVAYDTSSYNHNVNSYKLLNDERGGVIVIWSGFGSKNLYMQHINNSDALLLGSYGQKILDGEAYVNDAIGYENGVFIWPTWDRVVIKVDNEGNLLWRTNITDGMWSYDLSPSLVRDDMGGIIVVWPTYYSKPVIYAQRINSDGSIGVSTVKAPSNLKAIDTDCDNGGSIILNWTLSSDDGNGINKVIGYNIYRSLNSSGPYELIGRPAAGISSHIDNTAAIGIPYYYIIRANDGAKESEISNEASAISVRNLPLPPSNLVATDTPYDLGGSLMLTWIKSVDDGTGLNNVAGYNIYRYSSTSGNIIFLATLSAGATSFVDNATLDSDIYFYIIKAQDSQCNLESAASNIASGQSINNLTALPGFISGLSGISVNLINSLTSKIENAINVLDSGNETAAINILNALQHEIVAQSGKDIEVSTANSLINYIQGLISYISNNK